MADYCCFSWTVFGGESNLCSMIIINLFFVSFWVDFILHFNLTINLLIFSSFWLFVRVSCDFNVHNYPLLPDSCCGEWLFWFWFYFISSSFLAFHLNLQYLLRTIILILQGFLLMEIIRLRYSLLLGCRCIRNRRSSWFFVFVRGDVVFFCWQVLLLSFANAFINGVMRGEVWL